jgi:hypothetical protein
MLPGACCAAADAPLSCHPRPKRGPRLGDTRAVPAAVAASLLGLREGGRRRVLVPPALGWAADDGIGPPLPDFTAARRLATHRREPLLFEAELVKVCTWQGPGGAGGGGLFPSRTPPRGLACDPSTAWAFPSSAQRAAVLCNRPVCMHARRPLTLGPVTSSARACRPLTCPQVAPPRAAGEGGSEEASALLASEAALLEELTQRPGTPYRLPTPRSPFQKNLG